MKKLIETERNLIDMIAGRIWDTSGLRAGYADREDAILELTLAHLYNPLNLEALLTADDFNFAHDVVGIHHHLNRESGQFIRCFQPRFLKIVGH